MLGKPTNYIKPLGLNQRLKATPGSALTVKNARWDTAEGWRFDRGLEPWWHPGSSLTLSSTLTYRLSSKVDALFVWTKQNTEQTYFFVEQNGVLGYFIGNKNGSTFHADFVELATARHIPSTNEPGTQFVPYGNKLLILNGYDAPLWFSGDEKVRAFSFTMPAPTPEVADLDPGFWDNGETTNGIASPKFTGNWPIGLGDTDSRSSYAYRMSFLTDTGSESPLSSPVLVSWDPDGASQEGKYGVVLADLPKGPKGTAARRIYRTKNTKTGRDVDGLFYFLKQVNENASTFLVDVLPDSFLVSEASNSSVAISTAYTLGAAWSNRVWLGGGSAHATRIIYSEAGKPEEFGAFNFFELGSTSGGAITALVPYYNNLIVFRQRGIDIIRVNNTGYTVSQLTPEIGTEATNTIKLVPSLGLVFLAADGIYSLRGGLDGGSSISVESISSPVERELKRLNRGALARATAVYSNKEREYWIHYPIDGDGFNSRGLVLHTDIGQWSNRYHEDKTMSSFTCLATDPQGNILIGIKPTWDGLPTLQGSTSLSGLIHVWSGAAYWGHTTQGGALGQSGYAFTFAENTIPEYIYETNWISLGDRSTKGRVLSVEVELISYGPLELSLSWGTEGSYKLSDELSQTTTRPEDKGSLNEPAAFGAGNVVPYKPTAVLEEGRIVRLRWDVSTGLIETFRFKLNAANQFLLLGYSLAITIQEQKPLNTRAGA